MADSGIPWLKGLGNCHLIHHVWSHIPWYRVGDAKDLMHPALLAQGVTERCSL
jgi:fatty acid desaturase